MVYVLVFYVIVYNAIGIKIVDICSIKNLSDPSVNIDDLEFIIKFFNRCYKFVFRFAFIFDIFESLVDVFDLNF